MLIIIKQYYYYYYYYYYYPSYYHNYKYNTYIYIYIERERERGRYVEAGRQARQEPSRRPRGSWIRWRVSHLGPKVRLPARPSSRALQGGGARVITRFYFSLGVFFDTVDFLVFPRISSLFFDFHTLSQGFRTFEDRSPAKQKNTHHHLVICGVAATYSSNMLHTCTC